MENCIITCTEELLEFTLPYRHKEVTILLEFPEEQNEEAADDFISRLKELYLKKIKIQSGGVETPVLYSQSANEKEEKDNG